MWARHCVYGAVAKWPLMDIATAAVAADKVTTITLLALEGKTMSLSRASLPLQKEYPDPWEDLKIRFPK